MYYVTNPGTSCFIGTFVLCLLQNSIRLLLEAVYGGVARFFGAAGADSVGRSVVCSFIARTIYNRRETYN